MRKILICIILTTFAFLSLSCTSEATNRNNVNQTNSVTQTNMTPAATPAAEAIQENVNVKPAETPLPEFTNAETAFAEGNKLFDASENEKAVEAYKQAVKLNPDFAEAYFKLGIAYSLLEKEQEASENPDATPTPKPSKKAKKDAPPPTKANKSFENAVKAYKKILTKNPKDDAAHFNLGRSYNKLNDDKEAQKSLSQAVKLKPDDSQYQTELGAILIKLAQYDEAVAALKKAIKLDEGNLQAEEMLEDAEAGKKRVDYGANKIVKSKQ